MYHSIAPHGRKPSSIWAVSANSFRRQMELLKENGWHSALFSDLLDADSLPEKSVVITFDDGFVDNFNNGFRVLSDLGMRATWFLISQKIGERFSPPSDVGSSAGMLNEGQVREMMVAGMEIGAHTRTHAVLPELSADEVWDEVKGSKDDLERLLGAEVASFAYPFGRYDQASVDAVIKAGFRCACSTETGWFGKSVDMMRIRRVPVFSYDSLSRFARKLAFADPNVSWSRVYRYGVERVRERLGSTSDSKGGIL